MPIQSSKTNMSPVAAGFAAFTVGSAVGAIAYYALSNERNRKKLTHTFNEVRDGIAARVRETAEQVPNSHLVRKSKIAKHMSRRSK